MYHMPDRSLKANCFRGIFKILFPVCFLYTEDIKTPPGTMFAVKPLENLPISDLRKTTTVPGEYTESLPRAVILEGLLFVCCRTACAGEHRVSVLPKFQ